ncbi:diguanylate cyclase domain-containing protein [Cryptosporangium sp. NPDC051539]|uniref:diguanylate cyclase domain-containing protein n=1 Tax=Cryptosporangium sp. NPDC051539 TaxID=3363962 RepID=UPI003793CDD7
MKVRQTVRSWSLLQRVRALFLAYALINLVPAMAAVVTAPGSTWELKALIVAGLAGFAPWWVLGWRRRNFVSWAEPVEWVVLAGIATVVEGAVTVGLAFAMVYYRSLFGTVWNVVLRIVCIEAALITPAVLGDFSIPDRAAPVIIALMSVVMHVLSVALTQHERLVARERVLAEGARTVVAATDRQVIYQTAVDTALALAGGGALDRATLAGGGSTTTEVLAAAGRNIDGLVGLRVHLDQMPPGLLAKIRTGDPLYLDGDDCAALNRVAEVPVCQGGLFLIPLRSAKHQLGMLTVGSDGTLHPEIRSSLLTWAAQVASSLESLILNQELAHRAFHDPLTGLPNRALVHDRLHVALNAGRDSRPVAFMLLDLDGFKQVNDGSGHKAGDDLLCSVATRLLACVRQGDTVGRLGGDEFAVILPGVASRERAATVASRLVDAVRMPVVADGRLVGVGVSVGIAFAEPGTDIDELVRAADTAMYQVKAAGSGGYAIYAAETTPSTA